MTAQYTPPGRLGNPDMSVGTDPRTNRKLAAVLETLHMGQNLPATDLDPRTSSLEQIKGNMAQSDTLITQFYAMMPNDLPGDDSRPAVTTRDITITGVDANDVKLQIFRQAGTEGQVLPCVMYIHGGGMTILETFNKVHAAWCTDIALMGVVVVLVDYRNAYTPESKGGAHHPFPAGLNDCAAAVRYVAAHKSEIGISKLVLQGESGGGNLVCATALKAKKEGWVQAIDGVYANVPYISCGWGWPEERRLRELPSTIENNGYFLEIRGMACMGHYYTPNDADKTNPLAWPYHASMEDVTGLPPHIVEMDELDPLRDEGIAYARKLEAAGVSAVGRVNLGVVHGSSLIFRQAMPDLHMTTVNNIANFAKSLDSGTVLVPAKLS